MAKPIVVPKLQMRPIWNPIVITLWNNDLHFTFNVKRTYNNCTLLGWNLAQILFNAACIPFTKVVFDTPLKYVSDGPELSLARTQILKARLAEKKPARGPD